MIAEKILKIMEEVQPVIRMDDDKYGVEKAIEVIHPLLVKYKVMILPKKILNCSTSNSNKVANIGMLYQFIDVESPGEKESIEIEILGGGYDETGVRTIYNALSGAYRYALQQVFAFTVKDKDSENKNEGNNNGDNDVQQVENKDAQTKVEAEPKTVDEISNEDIDELFKFDSEVA